MNVAFFGGLDRRPFPPGWMKETVVSIFGGSDVDLSSSPPGPDARLTAVAVLGGVKILVPLGTRVSVTGLALFGGREVKVSQSGDGPEVNEFVGIPRRRRGGGADADDRDLSWPCGT